MNQPQWFEIGSPAEDVAELAQRFAGVHGHQPDGVWAAPGRVNLIGEHVDYNEGQCLPFALAHRTYAAIGLRTDSRITLQSDQIPEISWQGTLDEVGPGHPQGWPAYPLGVAWALAQQDQKVGGFDAVISSRVPLGSGLSSSAAIESAVAIGLDELFGHALTRARLAQICVRAENEIAQAPTGGMDQSASLQAQAGYAMLLDCRDFSFSQIPFRPSAAGMEILVMDTRAHHALTDGQYGGRREECAQACERLGVSSLRELADRIRPGELDGELAMMGDDEVSDRLRRRARHIVTEIGRVHQVARLLTVASGRLGLGDVLKEVGPILNNSHISMRDDYEISCAELDLAVSVACQAGAAGARMTGGGFGGSAIALIQSADRDRVAAAVLQAFASAGFRAPAFAVARPSGAAERAR